VTKLKNIPGSDWLTQVQPSLFGNGEPPADVPKAVQDYSGTDADATASDIKDGRRLRDKGMSAAIAKTHKTVDREWMDKAYAKLREFLVEHSSGLLCEDFRAWALENGLPAPASTGTWGAMWNGAGRAGIIVPDGEFRQAADPKSHARRLFTWRKA
jgi:hypothetical protein